MIIDYNDNNPTIPTDPDTGVIDWLGVKELAIQQHDWYARGASVMPDNQRLVNIWYIYCWMKYSGYGPIAMRALASMMWYESGYDGSQWGTGLVRSDTAYREINDPIYERDHEGDPDYIIGYKGYTKIVASNWATLPDSAPIVWSIPIAGNLTNPVIMTYPSYGLVQWTPYTVLRGHSDAYGQQAGENWINAYLNNSTLQCFILDWEQSIADVTPPEGQSSLTYMGEWVDRRGVGDYPDIVECTWQEWKDDSYLSEITGTADDLFLNSCHQFIVHYVHGDPYERDTERLTVLHQYIDNAFTIWDNNGGGGLLDLPEPPGTIGDPWHLALYAILGKRRNKRNVRTILF